MLRRFEGDFLTCGYIATFTALTGVPADFEGLAMPQV